MLAIVAQFDIYIFDWSFFCMLQVSSKLHYFEDGVKKLDGLLLSCKCFKLKLLSIFLTICSPDLCKSMAQNKEARPLPSALFWILLNFGAMNLILNTPRWNSKTCCFLDISRRGRQRLWLPWAALICSYFVPPSTRLEQLAVLCNVISVVVLF